MTTRHPHLPRRRKSDGSARDYFQLLKEAHIGSRSAALHLEWAQLEQRSGEVACAQHACQLSGLLEDHGYCIQDGACKQAAAFSQATSAKRGALCRRRSKQVLSQRSYCRGSR